MDVTDVQIHNLDDASSKALPNNEFTIFPVPEFLRNGQSDRDFILANPALGHPLSRMNGILDGHGRMIHGQPG